MHAIFRKVSASRRHWFIDNEYTNVGFLIVCVTQEKMEEGGVGEDEEMPLPIFTSSITEPLESDVQASDDATSSKRWVRVPKETMKVVVSP